MVFPGRSSTTARAARDASDALTLYLSPAECSRLYGESSYKRRQFTSSSVWRRPVTDVAHALGRCLICGQNEKHLKSGTYQDFDRGTRVAPAKSSVLRLRSNWHDHPVWCVGMLSLSITLGISGCVQGQRASDTGDPGFPSGRARSVPKRFPTSRTSSRFSIGIVRRATAPGKPRATTP